MHARSERRPRQILGRDLSDRERPRDSERRIVVPESRALAGREEGVHRVQDLRVILQRLEAVCSDNSSPVTGLFYGGGAGVFEAQLVGSFIITASTFLTAYIMMWIIRKFPHPWNLRVEEHGETMPGGLDMFDHGTSAYPEEDVDPVVTVINEGYKVNKPVSS